MRQKQLLLAHLGLAVRRGGGQATMPTRRVLPAAVFSVLVVGARHFHTVVFGIGPLLLPSLMGGRAVSGRHADLFTDNAAFTPPRDPDRFRLGWRPASRLASC